MNIPNALTLFRLVLIPVFVIVFYIPSQWSYLISAIVFFVAGWTDWLDGYLARKLNQTTPFGAFLDPVADKLMVSIALVVLVERFAVWYFTLPAIIIIGREIIISALREWMAELGKRTSVAVSYIGKIKTMAQMGAIFLFLLVQVDKEGPVYYLAMVSMYTAAALTIWSMFLYLKAAWPDLRPGNEN
ncbi:CDP-diacylglycerol--glycerol-3-phosphate 3-phosphatidyltransferase [BD1-7 clade bacterium]|uniref:CDP-diacylglycerol--glycerol-3-phosphate 3-phosphatidyltransferase n=1 Tax=BD1-7 clade bacterium TaxID=2029982 RepID=A0A5S9NN80_9GAMM|nr:CDP-diacylglycerol--glycerol-3-phosphate 3-phosphatidyltransferase [BD1-7 clade bacterium]CAA0094376.1 CDP-diacylglycerol--glycerol-3-phosphate 3-phosphatidyltransferase [BD1-7 clade bacterium]CAA0097489.1 CDP-diacylglycerol--glycerol-3-phosphate 3-phosphatidyltransferase [BD1-7 clade bacterium]CAA0122786.1 CDP-diacylglycerol--glycerol-3-phosphate 3-phosphatidyltransferase [BD1-7 clade bacterium]